MARYRYTIPTPVRKLIEWELRSYTKNKRRIRTGSIGDGSDRVRQRVMRISEAIEGELALCDETDRRIIELVYIKNKCTPTGAAVEAYVSASEAYARINRFLAGVAERLGYEVQKR